MVASIPVTFDIRSGDESIRDIDDWFRLAPPAGGLRHWKDGRSAKELARRWLAGYPPEVAQALDSHPQLEGFTPTVAEPEYETALDEFPRKRNHDLVVTGHTDLSQVLVCVEAKADEAFDDLISERPAPASSATNYPARLHRLAMGLFGRDATGLDVTGLRYQLVQACAGTIIEASIRGIPISVFLVQEFVTDATVDEFLVRNSADLNRFVGVLTAGQSTGVGVNQLIGPIGVPGFMTVPMTQLLFVGKASFNMRTTPSVAGSDNQRVLPGERELGLGRSGISESGLDSR